MTLPPTAGTTYFGEACAIVLRIVVGTKIYQRLIRFKVTALPLTGVEWSQIIVAALATVGVNAGDRRLIAASEEEHR